MKSEEKKVILHDIDNFVKKNGIFDSVDIIQGNMSEEKYIIELFVKENKNLIIKTNSRRFRTVLYNSLVWYVRRNLNISSGQTMRLVKEKLRGRERGRERKREREKERERERNTEREN